MKLHTIKCILCLVLAAIVTACNGDIFVDIKSEPSSTDIEIAGDGGQQTVKFDRNGIQRIGLDVHNGYNASYYDKDGNEIPYDSKVTEIARINYTNVRNIFDIYIDGNFLTFKSTELADDHFWHNTIQLDYGHTVQRINVSILPGRPMELKSIEFDMAGAVTDTLLRDSRTTHYTYSNDNPPATWRVYVMPYVNRQCIALISPDAIWARSDLIDITLPTYAGGQWTAGASHRLQMNNKFYYRIPRLDSQLKIPVDIRSNVTTNVVCTITYATIKTRGRMVFSNPVSGREHVTTFSCSVAEPLKYEINIDEVN